jgi:hypothetical protein
VPYLTLPWPYHRDRSVTGTLLRAAGHRYIKGLGVHSAARLTYRLDAAYRRFAADVALDETAGGGADRGGNVRFRVFVDGKQQAVTDPITGDQTPRSVEVDLTDAQRLDLIVEYAQRAAVLDRADWLDARLVR